MRVLLFSFIFTFLISVVGHAFPEMVRHGYVNCTTCHVSPTGGGILTPYGRSLSKEVLSTWASENEELVGHGLVSALPEWLNLGGDYRTAQTYLDTDTTERASNFNMQSDVEIAFSFQKFVFDSTFGFLGGPDGTPGKGTFTSHRHFVLFQLNDAMAFRAGRFYPQFGIYLPNHTSYTRRYNGFDQGRETYNLEFSFSGEKNDFFIDLIGGRPDDLKKASERGFSFSYSHALTLDTKLGMSGLATSGSGYQRQSFGVFGIIKAAEKIYVLSEVDGLFRQVGLLTGKSGVLGYVQLGYEVNQGVHFYGVGQVAHDDFRITDARRDSYGVGFKFYPRPHFELNGEFDREKDPQTSAERYESAWLVFHYYL
ncbi:MAG: hypothetical protein K2X47_05465 [Bdellovibrionales bacterium]|nr:hypothetical protein [Bdellovibrionales bacterium]